MISIIAIRPLSWLPNPFIVISFSSSSTSSRLTGASLADASKEVSLSIQRLFHWGAFCDKYGGTIQETTLYGVTAKIHEPVGVIG